MYKKPLLVPVRRVFALAAPVLLRPAIIELAKGALKYAMP